MARKRRKLTLWQWGLVFIFSGLVTGMLMNVVKPIEGNSRRDRADRAGRAAAQATVAGIGVVLIAVDLVRRGRGAPSKSRR